MHREEPAQSRGERRQEIKVYISGPITSNPRYLDDFKAAEDWVRKSGHTPINPASFGLVEGWSWADYMKRDIPLLVDLDCLLLLDGWEESRGAKLEKHIAEELGLLVEHV